MARAMALAAAAAAVVERAKTSVGALPSLLFPGHPVGLLGSRGAGKLVWKSILTHALDRGVRRKMQRGRGRRAERRGAMDVVVTAYIYNGTFSTSHITRDVLQVHVANIYMHTALSMV